MEMNSTHEKAVESILYGQSCALRLKMRLDNPMADTGPVSNYDLAKSIIDSCSNAISILSGKPRSEDEYQFFYLTSSDFSPPPHGSHSKKRKIDSTNSSANWRDDSPVPIYYDGHLWRKYGQKKIQKSNHLRSYYRCAYHIDHNCGARKYEQKIKDNPPVYRTTYFGHHTCKTEPTLDAIFYAAKDPVDDLKSAQMIQFGKDLDQEKKSLSDGFSLPMDQYNLDCQHVLKEDLLSPSGSYPLSTSSGSETDEFNPDLLLDNLDSWELYDQFFGLL